MAGIVILGAGFIGHRLMKSLPDAVLSTADITDPAALQRVLATEKPKAVINAAGKTGRPNVDWCEAHKTETFRANVTGALTVAEVATQAGVHLLHMGSGCIFYGPSPYHGDGWHEDDPANPSAFYSRTKYAADLVLSRLPSVCVVRIRMPIDSVPHPRNLITKLASYHQVVDVENSVTVVDDMVTVLAKLIEKRAEGVFHVTNPGVMQHRELLALYREYVDNAHVAELIPEGDLVGKGLAVKARSNNVLGGSRLAELGITMRPIGDALRETMKAYGRALRQGSP